MGSNRKPPPSRSNGHADSTKQAEEFWNQLAQRDPLWAILSDPTRRGGRWDLDTFFRTGEREISTLMYQLERLLGAANVFTHRALDFGCGVGRLTQALARYYGNVVGVDISLGMIEHARRLNRHRDRVTYLHNTRQDLAVPGTFDLIYSDLVLQHMPPDQSLRYIGDFIELLAHEAFWSFSCRHIRRQRLRR
jgi:2-polyprenyl-3-methyl-5-hydroxy-6-metoxy-1,4-benzoquinol methylase